MSHAANLRKYRPQSQNNLPQKKRKLSPSADALQKPTNGVLHSTKPLSAVPTVDAKAHKQASVIKNGNAVVSHAQDADSGDDKSSSSSDSDDDSEDLNSDSSSDEEAEVDKTKHTSDDEEDSSSSSDSESEDSEEKAQQLDLDEQTTAGVDPPPTDKDIEEPSFGDLIASRAPEEIIDVDLPDENSHHPNKSLTTSSANQTLTVPSANSLGTVLTQALKTNDTDLLESCLHVPNLESIRATIERIHPSHATSLLQRLAERLHKRPGRAGSLMVWVQWTVVAHGGYLASQPDAMRELRTLYQVVKQRASGLQPLLALKGKLDMLEAQMQLRRNMQARSKANHSDAEEEEDVLYVEGEDDIDSADEERDGKISDKVAAQGFSKNQLRSSQSLDRDTLSDKVPLKLPNGIGVRNEDVEDESDNDDSLSDDDADDLIDDEAEEGDDSSSEMSEDIDYDDVDEEEDDEEEDEESEIEAPPAKRTKSTKRPGL